MPDLSPWTKKERDEIAQMVKDGRDDSYIRGSMKLSRRSNQIPPLPHEARSNTPMATKKKASKKKVTKKKVAKKSPARKTKARPGRKKGSYKLGDKIAPVKGLEDNFYKGFPRFLAYEMLVKKGEMKTDTFLANVEKLDGVKSRTQALGILQKLVDKGAAKMSGAKKASVKKAA